MALMRGREWYTLEEYYALEETSEERHEFYENEIYAMAGGSANHNRITRNLTVALTQELSGKPCEAFVNDLRLRLERVGLHTYPDVMVVCGGLTYAAGRSDEIVNPTLIAEVLSPSTEAYDRGRKFEWYRTLESFQEYLLLDQNRRYVEHYRRGVEEEWTLRVYHQPDEVIHLDSIGVEVPLEELYQRVDWESTQENGMNAGSEGPPRPAG